VVAGGVEHALGEPADNLAPLGVDVVQDDVREVEPLTLARETGDELRRVRRATADDGELHRWTPILCSATASGAVGNVLGTQTRRLLQPCSQESSPRNHAVLRLVSLPRWPPPAVQPRRSCERSTSA